MSDSNHKTYQRDGHGPRAVDGSKSRSSSRRDDDKQRSMHSSSRRPSEPKSSHRRKSSSASSAERPAFEISVLGQPSRNIAFGQTVEMSVMVCLRCPSPEMAANYRNIDTSRLMGLVSLVADSRSGERVPVEYGTLTGQKMFDSIHEMPHHLEESLSRNQPCRLVLGYFTFPSLLIRQPGFFRLRVTLLKMGGSGSTTGGGSSIAAADSDSIKVERRSVGTAGTGRKHGRA